MIAIVVGLAAVAVALLVWGGSETTGDEEVRMNSAIKMLAGILLFAIDAIVYLLVAGA